MPHYLSIDQSTSATKALLFDERLKLVDGVSIEHKQHYPKPGWVEHDAEEIWKNVQASVRALLVRQPSKTAALSFVSITNQRETVVVFDKETGKPLCPAMVWQCRRGTELCQSIVSEGSAETVEGKTGLKVDPYFSASKLKWLVENNSQIADSLQEGTALVGTIDVFLIYRMTQGRIFATDTTNASRTLLFDIETLDWDDELCSLWGVPRRALPEVVDSAALLGETNIAGALPKEIPICGVMGDSQAALFAQACHKPGQAKITFGTGSSVLLNTGSERLRPGNGVVETLAWSIGGKPTYAFEGIVISSGATLAWLRDQLGIFKDYSEVEALATSIEDNGGVYLVPAFTGLGLPYWKADARAAILGMSSQCDRRHVVRAALESIAFQVSAALSAMLEVSSVSLTGLRADGGATANGFLMQRVADLCETTLEVSQLPECSALGATMSGLLGMGYVSDLQGLSSFPREVTTYQASADKDAVQALRDGWNAAVYQVLAERKSERLEPVS